VLTLDILKTRKNTTGSVRKINNDKMRENNLFGFSSGSDFLSSLFGAKWGIVNSIPGFLLGLTSFITGYVYESAETVYLLWILMAFDWATGLLKSFKTKSFVSYKLFRMPIYYVATTLILSLSWWLSKNSFLFIPIPGIVIGGFYSVYFISMLENLGELEVLPKSIVRVLKNKFGLKAIVDKFDKNENDPSV
jgi:phage-related holin